MTMLLPNRKCDLNVTLHPPLSLYLQWLQENEKDDDDEEDDDEDVEHNNTAVAARTEGWNVIEHYSRNSAQFHA